MLFSRDVRLAPPFRASAKRVDPLLVASAAGAGVDGGADSVRAPGRTKSWSPTPIFALPEIGVSLPLAELYVDLVFDVEQDGDQAFKDGPPDNTVFPSRCVKPRRSPNSSLAPANGKGSAAAGRFHSPPWASRP
jgi:hypothetical protein